MRKLYDEFFYVPRQGNVREKVLVARVAVSVALILLCMAIMNFTAYAYFSCNVSSGINTIQSARYDLDITPPAELASAVDNGLDENDWTDVYVLDNSGNTEKTFSFTLTKSKDATAKVGYCKIEIKTDVNDASNKDDVQRFYTKPIGTYVENNTSVTVDSRNVEIVVAANKTATVTFVAEWGTCGEAPIEGEKIEPKYNESNSTKGVNAGSANTSQQSLDSLGTPGTGTSGVGTTNTGTSGTGTTNTGTSTSETPSTETPSSTGTADTNQPDSSNSANSSSSSSVGQEQQSSDNKEKSDTETDTNQQ